MFIERSLTRDKSFSGAESYEQETRLSKPFVPPELKLSDGAR